MRKSMGCNLDCRYLISHCVFLAPFWSICRSLYRDDTPRLAPDERIDLDHFQNRFPQVAKNTRLLQKVPRVAGKCSWDLTGVWAP
jgi:hypothetical protein